MSADVTANDNESSTASVSVEQRRRSAQRAWWYSGILVPLSFAALMLAALAFALMFHRGEPVDPIVVPHPDPPLSWVDRFKQRLSGDNSVPNETASDAALAKIDLELRHAEFDMEFAQAMQVLRHLESAKADWDELFNSTQRDNVGKRIAGSEQLLLRFAALRSLPPPSAPEQIARDVSAHLNTIQQRAKSAGDAESINRSIADAVETKQHFFIAFEFHQARVDQLNVIRESAASLPESEFELHAALSLRAAALFNNVNSAAEDAAQEMAASLEKELTQLKRQREQAAALVTQLNSQLTSVANGEALDTAPAGQGPLPLASRDDYERELDRIRTDLVAFTTHGYVQPETADQLVYHKTKRPMSYSALQRIGALADSEKGRSILLRVGGSKSATQQNDRPLGNFPRMNSLAELRKPSIVARLKESQRLLRQYGLLMVEDGLLSP